MDLRSGIVDTANALGMDPATLATIISFETGGTFDPLKRGPTTKWGTHRGLIQFGEPQARTYGVDWSNPLASQLGPDGAIAKYFRASGWKPGMSELQAYATVNAGSPFKINASDTAAGGTWGSVADKVNHQFGPHRTKAAALLGGEFAPKFNFPSAAAVPPVDVNAARFGRPISPGDPNTFETGRPSVQGVLGEIAALDALNNLQPRMQPFTPRQVEWKSILDNGRPSLGLRPASSLGLQ